MVEGMNRKPAPLTPAQLKGWVAKHEPQERAMLFKCESHSTRARAHVAVPVPAAPLAAPPRPLPPGSLALHAAAREGHVAGAQVGAQHARQLQQPLLEGRVGPKP
jgi:hypothetical protein